MRKYFGTDGVRAVAGQFPLTEDFIVKLGYCALKEIEQYGHQKGHVKNIIIAEDSRASGEQIANYLARGIRAAGYNVINIGIAPTPAVAYLTQKYNAVCGVVISASHNPAEFNGIKFFGANGAKLSEAIEEAIENLIEQTTTVPSPQEGTEFKKDETLIRPYIDFLKSTIPSNLDLKGTKVVLDCANGASYKIAPQIFSELGAKTIVLNNTPNGLNINENSGALHTKNMQEATKNENAFIGFSFDGDADRLIAADEEGSQLDGDILISIAAISLKEQGKLKQNKVVLTVMANLGLINFLKQNGIEPVLTQVGDKYVLEAMEKEDLSLGGETSGHIIFRDISRAGDGILCALQVLSIVKQSGKKPSWFKKQWTKYPLRLLQVKVQEKTPLDKIEGFLPYIKQLEESMQGKGRIFVRYSGTEPLLRILVEGQDEKQVEELAQKSVDFYKMKTGN
ncbi:MAG: phosphoglucosamine mutase [Elusimicrobiota bacterium]|jgi:phosphoglucosamine mutase|nr:phosphoglucosamine mutase [Elusimicrobiota bacterium]